MFNCFSVLETKINKRNALVKSKLSIPIILSAMFFFISKSATASLSPPTDLQHTLTQSSVTLTWEWGYDSEDDIGDPLGPSLYSIGIPSGCSFCGPVNSVNYEVEITYDGTNYVNVVNNLETKSYTINRNGSDIHKFRVRAKRIDSSTDTYEYSSYSLSKSIKLSKPIFRPEGNSIFSAKKVILTSAEGATIKYKNVAYGQSCTDSGWSTYFTGFSLSSDSRVCVKAIKSNWFPSEITHKDYKVINVSFIHTDLLGSPIAETN